MTGAKVQRITIRLLQRLIFSFIHHRSVFIFLADWLNTEGSQVCIPRITFLGSSTWSHPLKSGSEKLMLCPCLINLFLQLRFYIHWWMLSFNYQVDFGYIKRNFSIKGKKGIMILDSNIFFFFLQFHRNYIVCQLISGLKCWPQYCLCSKHFLLQMFYSW